MYLHKSLKARSTQRLSKLLMKDKLKLTVNDCRQISQDFDNVAVRTETFIDSLQDSCNRFAV